MAVTRDHGPARAHSAQGSRSRNGSGCAREMNDIQELYHELEVEAFAGPEQVRAAHAMLTRVWHPSRFDDDPRMRSEAARRLARIEAAYQAIVAAGFPSPPPGSEPVVVLGLCPWCESRNWYRVDRSLHALSCGACGGGFRIEASGRGVPVEGGGPPEDQPPAPPRPAPEPAPAPRSGLGVIAGLLLGALIVLVLAAVLSVLVARRSADTDLRDGGAAPASRPVATHPNHPSPIRA